jgi:hypothetical protein
LDIFNGNPLWIKIAFESMHQSSLMSYARAGAGDNAEIMPDARIQDTEKSFPQFRTFAERV